MCCIKWICCWWPWVTPDFQNTPFLARSANLPTGLYILPLIISFFDSRQIISGSTEPIFAIFAPNDRHLFEYDQSGPLFIPQGTLLWQPVKGENSAFFRTNLIWRAAILKGIASLQLRFQNFKKLNRMNFSTLCTFLVTFSPETPEFTLLTIAPFVAIWQKSAYHVKYLIISWIYLDLLYRFGRRIDGDDYPNVRLAVAQGTLLLSQDPVKCKGWSQTSQGTTFIPRFGVWQQIGRL